MAKDEGELKEKKAVDPEIERNAKAAVALMEGLGVKSYRNQVAVILGVSFALIMAQIK